MTTRLVMDTPGIIPPGQAAALMQTQAQRAAAVQRSLSGAPPLAPVARNIGSLTRPAAAQAPLAQVVGGGGGGGGGAAASVAAPAQTLQDFLNNNFLYTNQSAENDRDLQDYDAETLRDQQQVQGDQAQKRQALQMQLNDLGQQSAGDLASRGLLRSGLNLQAQDKINDYGTTQDNSIAGMLTDLLGQRTSGRVTQEQTNRAALNTVINQLTQQFNGQNLASV